MVRAVRRWTLRSIGSDTPVHLLRARPHHGCPHPKSDTDSGTIIGNIGRSPKNRKIYQVYPEGDQGKHAVTHYRVLERLGYVTLVECKLETGRTHQIRVHMKYIGHTLFNDKEYGGDKILKGTTFTPQNFLC